jgi:hypothetical protein
MFPYTQVKDVSLSSLTGITIEVIKGLIPIRIGRYRGTLRVPSSETMSCSCIVDLAPTDGLRLSMCRTYTSLSESLKYIEIF